MGVRFSMVLWSLLESLLEYLPESIRSFSDPLSDSLTESLQGVPTERSETKRAKPHAIASFLRL